MVGVLVVKPFKLDASPISRGIDLDHSASSAIRPRRFVKNELRGSFCWDKQTNRRSRFSLLSAYRRVASSPDPTPCRLARGELGTPGQPAGTLVKEGRLA